MARRQYSNGGGASLDSLLDTLTNVVGILIIMLIVTQVGAGMAVERIKGFVEEVSDEEYEAALAKSTDLQRLLEEQRKSLEEYDKKRPEMKLSLERQQELAASLKTELERLAGQQVDPDDLKKRLTEQQKSVEKIEAEILAREEKIASLKARLAETPAEGPDLEAKVVNLPDPRAAPKGAQRVIFLCRYGHIVPLDEKRLQSEAWDVLRRGQRTLVRDGKIDCDALKDRFNKQHVGDSMISLGISVGGDGKPRLVVSQMEGRGEPTERIARPNSLFNRVLRTLDPGKHYIEFHVWSDSFDTYLAARNEAARQKILAGWIPHSEKGTYTIAFGGNLETTCMGFTPPPRSPAAPQDPNRPPPPADVVD